MGLVWDDPRFCHRVSTNTAVRAPLDVCFPFFLVVRAGRTINLHNLACSSFFFLARVVHLSLCPSLSLSAPRRLFHIFC